MLYIIIIILFEVLVKSLRNTFFFSFLFLNTDPQTHAHTHTSKTNKKKTKDFPRKWMNEWMFQMLCKYCCVTSVADDGFTTFFTFPVDYITHGPNTTTATTIVLNDNNNRLWIKFDSMAEKLQWQQQQQQQQK